MNLKIWSKNVLPYFAFQVWYTLDIQFNISSVVEFQRWWVLKARFLAKNQHTGRKKILSMNVKSVDELGDDFSNKVVQKLKLEKNVSNIKWSPKLILSQSNFFLNIPSIFDIKN